MSLYDYTAEGLEKIENIVDAYFDYTGIEKEPKEKDQDESIYKGFCFDEEGRYTPAVTLKNVQEVINYCKLQGMSHYEIRITDYSEDDIIMQVIDGLVVWPENIKGLRISKL